MSTELHIAAGDDDLDEVKRLVKDGADVNKTSVAGLTPLHVAAGEVYLDLGLPLSSHTHVYREI